MSIRLAPRSLKYRLLLAFLVGMVTIGAGANYLAYRLMERHAWEQFDRMLAEKVHFYTSTWVFNKRGYPAFRMGRADWDRVLDLKDPDYWQVRYPAPDGRSIYRFKTLKAKDLPAIGTEGTGISYQDLTLPNGKFGRAAGSIEVVKQFLEQTPEGEVDFRGEFQLQPIQIVVARSGDSVEATLREVRWRLMAAAVAGTLALLGSAYLIIRRNFRTAGDLTRQIDAMGLTDTQNRFALPGAPLELEKVVGRLNALMDRVTIAIENERQFTSNAAHELRTPLAGMRSAIDLALTRTRTVAEYEDTLFKLKDMQWKLQQLTENLLLLARLDSGQREFDQEESTLRQFLRTVWKPFFDPACDKELNIAWKVEDTGTPLLLPTKLLEIVLRNIFQNAVEYSPSGGRIEISGHVADGICSVQVTNPNPGLEAQQLEQLFQRFWRADQSGNPNSSSVGIGLSLCKRIMDVLEGTISAGLTEENQVALRFSFPVPKSVPSTVEGCVDSPAA
jgi:two-component system heavy metal sensor histidine kinase CusS